MNGFLLAQMVDWIAEEDLIKSLVLAVELFISYVLSTINLSKSVQLNNLGSNDTGLGNTSALKEAIGSLVVFCAGAVVYSVGAIVCCSCIIYCNGDKCIHYKCKPVVTAFGGLFYYIGDNLPPLVEEYEHQLSCGQGCVEGIQRFGVVMLALAALTYLPIMVGGVVQSEDEEQEDKLQVHAKVILLLSKITDLDLVYTTIERVIYSDCPDERAVIGAWLYYAFFIAAFLLLLLGTLAIDAVQCKRSQRLDFVCGLINSILIFFCLACYILADNKLPLACSGLARDNLLVRDIVRFVFWIPPSLIALYGVCWFGVCKYKSTK